MQYGNTLYIQIKMGGQMNKQIDEQTKTERIGEQMWLEQNKIMKIDGGGHFLF